MRRAKQGASWNPAASRPGTCRGGLSRRRLGEGGSVRVSHGLRERAHVQDAFCRQRLDLGLPHRHDVNGLSHRVKYFQSVTRFLFRTAWMVFDNPWKGIGEEVGRETRPTESGTLALPRPRNARRGRRLYRLSRRNGITRLARAGARGGRFLPSAARFGTPAPSRRQLPSRDSERFALAKRCHGSTVAPTGRDEDSTSLFEFGSRCLRLRRADDAVPGDGGKRKGIASGWLAVGPKPHFHR